MFLPKRVLEEKLHQFLEEDIGQGDVTTSLTVPKHAFVDAEVIAKEKGLVAGIEEGLVFCESLQLHAEAIALDGVPVKPNTTIFQITGNARTVLSAERTLLNLLSRMSGIATITSQLVSKVRAAGYKTRVACTRKVAPGLSYLDKKAVSVGNGDTHRLHLDDMVLIKENHLKIAGDIKSAVRKIRDTISFAKKIEIETRSIEEALEAAETCADIIMLDNFSPKDASKAVALLTQKGVRHNVLLEASGGITAENILDYAATGVDIVSVGAITHSVKALDMSLEVVKVRKAQEI